MSLNDDADATWILNEAYFILAHPDTRHDPQFQHVSEV